jgi:hypothetical protein
MEGTVEQKYKKVQQIWCTRAMDPNDEDFSLDKIPQSQEIMNFSQEQGEVYAKASLSTLVNEELKSI